MTVFLISATFAFLAVAPVMGGRRGRPLFDDPELTRAQYALAILTLYAGALLLLIYLAAAAVGFHTEVHEIWSDFRKVVTDEVVIRVIAGVFFGVLLRRWLFGLAADVGTSVAADVSLARKSAMSPADTSVRASSAAGIDAAAGNSRSKRQAGWLAIGLTLSFLFALFGPHLETLVKRIEKLPTPFGDVQLAAIKQSTLFVLAVHRSRVDGLHSFEEPMNFRGAIALDRLYAEKVAKPLSGANQAAVERIERSLKANDQVVLIIDALLAPANNCVKLMDVEDELPLALRPHIVSMATALQSIASKGGKDIAAEKQLAASSLNAIAAEGMRFGAQPQRQACVAGKDVAPARIEAIDFPLSLESPYYYIVLSRLHMSLGNFDKAYDALTAPSTTPAMRQHINFGRELGHASYYARHDFETVQGHLKSIIAEVDRLYEEVEAFNRAKLANAADWAVPYATLHRRYTRAKLIARNDYVWMLATAIANQEKLQVPFVAELSERAEWMKKNLDEFRRVLPNDEGSILDTIAFAFLVAEMAKQNPDFARVEEAKNMIDRAQVLAANVSDRKLRRFYIAQLRQREALIRTALSHR